MTVIESQIGRPVTWSTLNFFTKYLALSLILSVIFPFSEKSAISLNNACDSFDRSNVKLYDVVSLLVLLILTEQLYVLL